MNDTRPHCILIDDHSAFMPGAETVWSRFLIIDIENLLENSSQMEDTSNLSDSELLCHGELLAVIYTSGSTGTPKGVCIKHKSAMNRLFWQWKTFPFVRDAAGCFKTSRLFVDSIVELFSSILQLIPLVIIKRQDVIDPSAFVRILEQHHITRLTVVPSLLRNVLFYINLSGGPRRLPKLKFWVCNSETLNPELAMRFFATFKGTNNRILANFYGCTETMADVTYEIYSSNNDVEELCKDNHLSVGEPMFNNNIYIVDEDENLIKHGKIGEICVSGEHVANGYIDGDLNEKAFKRRCLLEEINGDHLSDPKTVVLKQTQWSLKRNRFRDKNRMEKSTLPKIDPNSIFQSHERELHEILYHTGDFGRIVNKRLIYEGRRDMQIKIHGYRVNIAEIEGVIQQCEGVLRVTVLCHTFSETSSVIVAYYTTTANYTKACKTSSIIKDACRKFLPVYMRPKVLHVHDIPLQPHTGKVERVALRKLYEKSFNRQSSKELSLLDEKGSKAANIISLNLNLPNHVINRKKSFFDLGGNSISMVATIVQFKEYGLYIPIELFSKAKTIQEIIDRVVDASMFPDCEMMFTDRYVVCPLNDAMKKVNNGSRKSETIVYIHRVHNIIC